MLFLLLLITLQSGYSAGASQDCPAKCSCNPAKGSVECTSKNLTLVPTGIPRNVTLLDLSHNSINSLHGLSNFTQLTTLILSDNRLSTWNASWLSGSTSLSKLYLSQNQLSEPPAGLCNSAPALQRLWLDSNKLAKAGFSEDYLNCTQLQALTLSENSYSSLDNGTLANLTNSKLQSLALVRLNLSAASPDSLRVFADSLESLDISQNPLLSEPAIGSLLAGSNFKKLRSLMLRASGLVRLSNTTLAGVSTLLTLRLDGSRRLSELAPAALRRLQQLQVLSLRTTNVSGWPPELLQSAKRLSELDLRDTQALATVGGRAGDVNPLPQLTSPTFLRLWLSGAGLSCDCRLLWLTQALASGDTRRKLQQPDRTLCARPPPVRGRPLLSFQPSGCDDSAAATLKVVAIVVGGVVGAVAVVVVLGATVACARRRCRRPEGPRLVLDDDCDPLVAPGQRVSVWIRLRRLLRHRQSQQQQQQQQRHQAAGRPPIFDPHSPEDYLSEDA